MPLQTLLQRRGMQQGLLEVTLCPPALLCGFAVSFAMISAAPLQFSEDLQEQVG